MKVLLVAGESPGPSAGGIGTVTNGLSEFLSEREVEHKLLCTQDVDHDDDRVVSLPSRGVGLASVLDFGKSVRRFILVENSDWDVVHFHLPSGVGPLLFCPSSILQRSVVTFHTTAAGFRRYVYDAVNFGDTDARGIIHKLGYARLHEIVERAAVRRAGTSPVVTSVSSGVRDEIRGMYDRGVDRVVANGIRPPENPSDRAVVLPDTPRVLMVGRHVLQKGFAAGIQALSRVNLDFELTIVGTGPQTERLENAARKAGIGARFEGYVDEERLEQLYSVSSLLLMPSLYEGLPMVGIEAASHGLPIVAFERARVRDIVCSENLDYIVPNKQVSDLAAAISDILTDGERAAKIGDRNRKRVRKQFTRKRMGSDYLCIYEGLE